MPQKLSQGTSSIFLSDGISPSINLTRTIHPVGQGAFYSEIFSAHKKKLFTTVYDCGSNNKRSLTTETKQLDKVNLVFISHFHEDHINGINEIRQNGNPLIIIPGISHYTFVIDLIYNYLHTGDKRCGSISLMLDCLPALSSAKNNSNKQKQILTANIASNSDFGTGFYVVQEGVASIPTPVPIDDSLLWRYDAYFHKYDKGKEKELILELSKRISALAESISDDFKDEIWYRNLIDGLSELDLDDIKKVFTSIYKGSQNRYSMLVHSYPVDKHLKNMDCLYTGDIPITESVKTTIINIMPHYIQVPHHGSEHNYDESIYNNHQISFISVGRTNRYEHPHRKTLIGLIQKCKTVHMITEATEDNDSKCYKCRFKLK